VKYLSYSPVLTYPTCIWRPAWGDRPFEFIDIFGFRKLESLAIVPVFACMMMYLAVLIEDRHVRIDGVDRHRVIAYTAPA